MNSKFVVIAALIASAIAHIPTLEDVKRTTDQRIREYNYPVEVHEVHTSDAYILTVFRIPYSPTLQNQDEYRPAVYAQHGVTSSSDAWILNCPEDSLVYLLVDAGYDVWLGNARGNRYSKNHETLSTSESSFWNFSFHEIALYDASATIDYILDTTGETAIHYIGHSMGTTVFLVLMASRPEYNAKIKTCHLMAPLAYSSHIRSPLNIVASPFFGRPSLLSAFVENNEFMPHSVLQSYLMSIICSDGSPIQSVCVYLQSFFIGWNSTHINTTLLGDYEQTHSAGTSTNVPLHYIQEYASGRFCLYDHGLLKNLIIYNQISPPDYNVSNIVAPIWLYYSDNDYAADVEDVKILEGVLPNMVESFHVPYPDWNHLDFLLGLEVKDTLYERIIEAANHFEVTGETVPIES